ncbi:hypothetical protein RHECNPAF_3340091 [Rhizobium etli CNPAF512]|nr:hypothetical protein RHECNPAF_3340091 [Rhizobium etli CNPAF512]
MIVPRPSFQMRISRWPLFALARTGAGFIFIERARPTMRTVRMPPTASVTEKVKSSMATKTVAPASMKKMERMFCMGLIPFYRKECGPSFFSLQGKHGFLLSCRALRSLALMVDEPNNPSPFLQSAPLGAERARDQSAGA